MIEFFAVQRQIFGVCSCCGEIFRLSDANVYLKKKPLADWMDKYELSGRRIDTQEDKLAQEKEIIKEAARVLGRKEATKAMKKVDNIFTPRKLNPDDAKVVFHPIDYMVFNGMKEKTGIKNILFMDREVKGRESRALQKSIEKTIEKENYEWITVQISETGEVEYK